MTNLDDCAWAKLKQVLGVDGGSRPASESERVSKPQATSASSDLGDRLRALVAKLVFAWDSEDSDQFAEAIGEAHELDALIAAPVVRPRLTVSELRGGEDNTGQLESTDIFVEGRGISLLVNVPAGSRVTYSLGVDGQTETGGEVAAPVVRPEEEDAWPSDGDGSNRWCPTCGKQTCEHRGDGVLPAWKAAPVVRGPQEEQ